MVSIPTQKLKSGEDFPILGLGTWTLEGEKCKQTVENALNMGYIHIDTAESYGNEEEIGEVLQEYDRSKVFLTSKVSPRHLHYEDVIAACEASLERLDTSYLDLYLIHWPNPAISLREPLGAMNKLYDRGLLKSIGVSNFHINQLKVAMTVSELPISVNQVEFHPLLYRKDLLDFCNEHDIAVTAAAPLARTEVFQDKTIQELANTYDKTPAQIVIRWELQKNVVSIPRTTSKKHLRENLQVLGWKLKEADMKKIDKISKTKVVYEYNFKGDWIK